LQGSSNTSEDDEQLLPGPSGAVDKHHLPPPDSPGPTRERQQSPSFSPEIRGSGHRKRKTNSAADSPSKKRQKIVHDVNGKSSNTWRSSRERRQTAMAAEKR